MSDNSHIEWTDASWNPIRARRTDATPADLEIADLVGWHCERVSPGCQHCYAETINEKRFGTGLPYNRKSRDLVRIDLDEKALLQPLHWRRPRKVFVCSMTDLFGEWVPDEVIDRVFAVMALSPQHTFQVLTKRPERMREYVTARRIDRMLEVHRAIIMGPLFVPKNVAKGTIYAGGGAGLTPEVAGEAGSWAHDPSTFPWPLANVWLGTSVEDQPRANERIGHLLATPAAVRFLSCEPLLGAVDLQRVQPDWLPKEEHPHDPILRLDALQGLITGMDEYVDWDGGGGRRSIDWVIVGGESGPGARPMDLAWARSLVQQCQAAGVKAFVKQDSGPKPGRQGRIPDDLWLKEFPDAR